MDKIAIRPGFAPYFLASAMLMSAGSALTRAGQVTPAAVCMLLLAPLWLAALFDRIEFDGSVLRHRGPMAFLLRLFGMRRELDVAHIERITTEATSVSMKSGTAKMSYRTRVSGSGVEILLRSHRATYLPMIKALFRAVGPHKLDPRSFELYEYFETDQSIRDTPVLRSEIAAMPAPLLRRIANSLRLAGRLAQASSYFRIAYEKEPRNPELLYEMSRFFRSSAQVDDARLIQRSDACLRLASRLAGEKPDLLERLGEAFYERLDYKRATECFRRAIALDPARFRSNVGLAEIALKDGKLAHVAQYYNAAASGSDMTLARMAEREARYYERLASDEDFLERELRRINASNQIRWARRAGAATFFLSWLVAITAGRFYPQVEHFTWALMGMTAIVWAGATFTLRFFRRRED
ncbi:MAG: tetratricopeptide repeat protein [Acidobacteriota bacterium]